MDSNPLLLFRHGFSEFNYDFYEFYIDPNVPKGYNEVSRQLRFNEKYLDTPLH